VFSKRRHSVCNGVHSIRGFPFQSPPLLDEHQPDARAGEIGQKGIVPKAVARMWHGTPGCLAWKSATTSAALPRLSQYSQLLFSIP